MEQVLCRLCLAPSNSTVALFDDDSMQPNVLLIQKVIECTSIRLSAEEDYPSSVCCECERKLNEWSTFKIQCIVNNDFYRQKQRELRRRLVAAQQQQHQKQQPRPPKSPEVVCLDDDEETVPVKAPPTTKVEQVPKRKESPAKRAKVVAEVVIEDDDDEEKDQHLTNEDGLLLEDDEEALLNDYQLVEGQEYPSEPDYESLADQQSADHYESSTAILSSILLDDDDDDDDDEYEGNRQNPGSGGPFQCWQCRRGYSSLTKLRMHEKLHSERMKCFVCGKMIVLQLVRHMRSQHPGQMFPEPVRCWHSKCANSPEVYYTVDQLLEHMDSKKRK
ncbi:uncharacterized protein LOC120430978 [Culex pipiens pallens]|uniref:uncharacterized protein LOC120430978 n=1 Tax=Culex pipiens pallens TaxID=42434 RepID=UPI001954056A|nr:uncharacterized protein LOC120430978 [Culex pipiens pallens]